MHETGVAVRQRDRQAGADQRPLPRPEHDVRGARSGRPRRRRAGPRPESAVSGSSRTISTATGGRPDGAAAAVSGSCWGASTGPDTSGDATLGIVEEQPATPSPATSGTARFDERLSVPLWWYLPAVAVAVLLGAEVHMGYPGVRSWIGYAITVPLAVLVLVGLGRIRVRVTDDELQVGPARLALRYVGRVDVVGQAGQAGRARAAAGSRRRSSCTAPGSVRWSGSR